MKQIIGDHAILFLGLLAAILFYVGILSAGVILTGTYIILLIHHYVPKLWRKIAAVWNRWFDLTD